MSVETSSPRADQATHPNIVWVTLDSLRADHTTMAGYERNTTPNLQRIVDDGGLWFPHCHTHAHWTPSATASILTGTHITTHGVGYHGDDVSRVPESLQTVPELLRAVGYRTAGFSTNGYFSQATDLDRGFETFCYPSRADLKKSVRTLLRYGFREFDIRTSFEAHKRNLTYQLVEDMSTSWLGGGGSRPSFLYLHLNHPHHPYTPPRRHLEAYAEEKGQSASDAAETAKSVTDNLWERMADGCNLTKEEFDALHATYDGEINAADEAVGRLFECARSLEGETVFVVTGDHGELFGEHGVLGHNLVLHDGISNVPMVVHGMDALADKTDTVVQHADVMGTILSHVGADTSQFESVDLTKGERKCALSLRGPRSSDLEKLRDMNRECDVSRFHEGQLDVAQNCQFKYQRSDDREELFELPAEETNCLTAYPDVAAELGQVLEEEDLTLDSRDRKSAEFNAEMEEHLSDLGYL